MIEPKRAVLLREMPSGTVLEWQVYKPHAACLQVIVVAPTGDYYVYREVRYHSEEKVASNRAGEELADPPAGWNVESAADAAKRLNPVNLAKAEMP